MSDFDPGRLPIAPGILADETRQIADLFEDMASVIFANARLWDIIESFTELRQAIYDELVGRPPEVAAMNYLNHALVETTISIMDEIFARGDLPIYVHDRQVPIFRRVLPSVLRSQVWSFPTPPRGRRDPTGHAWFRGRAAMSDLSRGFEGFADLGWPLMTTATAAKSALAEYQAPGAIHTGHRSDGSLPVRSLG